MKTTTKITNLQLLKEHLNEILETRTSYNKEGATKTEYESGFIDGLLLSLDSINDLIEHETLFTDIVD